MLVKVVLFAIWAATVDLWIARHFHGGLGLDEILILIGVPLGSAWFTSVFDFFVDPEAKKTFQGYLQGWIKRQFNYRVIGLLYLGFTMFALTYSTLSITPPAGNVNRTVSLTRVGASEPVKSVTSSFAEPLDLRLFINPFATQYHLAVSGYLPKVVSIRPLLGTIVIPELDLKRIPSILFRPSSMSYNTLKQNGWFMLYRMKGEQFEKVAEQQGKHAWTSGPRRPQPAEMRAEWQLETTAEGLDPKAEAILILRWRNPKMMPDVADIGPGEVICALVTNIDKNKTRAGAVVTIGSSEYVDIPLENINNEMAITSSGDDVCKWLYLSTD